ncbi:MAG: helix-turn-helix domain-containing protein [Polaribacter sp.]|mgnify:FL=1
MDNSEFRSSCTLSSALDLVGDRWSLLIIRDLFLNRNTYSAILKSPEKISTNVLVDRIKKLRSNGIIDFVKDKNDKKIKYYYLTDSGVDFYRVITEFSLWTKKHLNKETSPLSVAVFKEIDLKGVDVHNKDAMKAYLKTRAEILNK